MEQRYILASQSPRRQELLRVVLPEFEVKPCHAPEEVPEGLAPCQVVEHLARQKAGYIAAENPGAVVIGSDTVVSIDGQILGKPRDKADCLRMLDLLSGRSHTVYTGVAFAKDGACHSFWEATEVEFYPLSDQEKQWYAGLEEPYDKAGSYGIQGQGSLLVRGIRGDYFNVMGLPVARLWRELRDWLGQIQ